MKRGQPNSGQRSRERSRLRQALRIQPDFGAAAQHTSDFGVMPVTNKDQCLQSDTLRCTAGKSDLKVHLGDTSAPFFPGGSFNFTRLPAGNKEEEKAFGRTLQ
ncbi:hypothetical protein [Novosphingobium lindaniclasticum]|jgi:hypothetical protein|uniref:hypothetical protein n=1 Tax=Novosphingobium lindaniclasticum TaxID=1329895 RepID=UPI0024099DB3|nr:hypothetical protein [Novosphingobium lindaniclasticum]